MGMQISHESYFRGLSLRTMFLLSALEERDFPGDIEDDRVLEPLSDAVFSETTGRAAFPTLEAMAPDEETLSLLRDHYKTVFSSYKRLEETGQIADKELTEAKRAGQEILKTLDRLRESKP